MDGARTVVVSGVPVHVLPASRTADKLIIHFQSRRRSHGGDVSEVTYPTSMEGVAFVTFDHPEDAARVVKKERHILTDGVFPEEYDLTVFPFSNDVFFYVSTAKVDLSFFQGDQSSLIESLRSSHRSLRFRPLPLQKAAEIEGPFAAVKALRTDLLRRVESLQTDSVKLAGVNLNPTVAAHPEASVSLAASEAKEPAASGSLSGLPQRTGEMSEAQSRLSKGKTPNDFLTQTASGGILPIENFWDVDVEDGLKKFTGHRTNSLRRQVVGEESNPRFLPSLSDLNLLPAEDVKRQKVTMHCENHSAFKYVKSLSSSAVPSEKDSTSSDSTKQSLSPEGRQDIWLDSYTFQYVERFYKAKLEACLIGVTSSVKHLKESDLLRVSLTARPNSPGGFSTDEAYAKLQDLMSYWQLILSINQVDYKKMELNDKEKLMRICEDISTRFGYVLYVIEDSCVKVIGLPKSTRLFYEELKDRIAQWSSLKM